MKPLDIDGVYLTEILLKLLLTPSPAGYTDRVVHLVCEELNATETVFPRTNLRLVLKLGAG